MKILMVLLQKFPPDIRVEKETRSLVEAGHKVCILATGTNSVVEDCLVDESRVVRLPEPKGWKKRYHEIKDALIHRDSFWINRIVRVARLTQAEVIHGHDLWVLGNCVAAGNKLGIPVIADLHENWPAAMRLFHPRDMWLDHLTHPILFGYANWARFEKRILQKVDRIITVVPEAADRLARMHGLARETIAVVSNTDDYTLSSEPPAAHTEAAGCNGKFTLVYAGGFQAHRGLDFVIKAMPLVASRVPHIKLLLIGRGREKYLRQLIQDSKAEPFVELVGWQPLETVYRYIQDSNVGLVPHVRHEHTDNTVPHKLFQYMNMGKPVIVSDCPPLKRIVEETHAGLVFNDMDPSSFIEAVSRLAGDPDLSRELGERGHAGVQQKYNWRQDANVLIGCYRELARGLKRDVAASGR